ncbi:MAG TPA: TonB family protein [Blastocatellia bacterium]|nr:TonB family protein [Blastocatellia bacterium]
MNFHARSTRRLMIASVAMTFCLVPIARAQATQDKPEPPKIIRKSGGVLQGSATRRVEPAYPPLAKAARLSGSVVVEVTVDEEGNVISARAISGHPLLKDPAVGAARGWKFEPTLLQGTAVKVIGTITFNFNFDYSRDIAAIRQRLTSDPNSAQLHYELGQLLRFDKQYDESIAEYSQAIALERDYVEAYLGLASVYQATGRSDESIEACKRGLNINSLPGFAEMLNIILGEAFLKQDRNQEALEAFKQAVAAKSDSVEGHYNLGLTYLKIGDKQSAQDEYKILKDLNEQMSELLRRSIERKN